MNDGRYESIIKVWTGISSYRDKVAKDVQPYSQVANHVRHANRQYNTNYEFRFTNTVIQSKGHLLATVLLLTCDISIFTDFIGVCMDRKIAISSSGLNLAEQFRDCENLITTAKSSVHPREEVQGHIFFAQFCHISHSLGVKGPLPHGSIGESSSKNQTSETLKGTGMAHVNQARSLLIKFPSTSPFGREIDAIENTLSGCQYRPVSDTELRSVYHALATELRGTGHWYTCQNGHPFTIGECGMPMEEARCPECNALIGGQNHRAVDGVQRATEMEQIAEGLDRLQM